MTGNITTIMSHTANVKKRIQAIAMYFRQRKRKGVLKDDYYVNMRSGKSFLLEAQSERILQQLHTRIAASAVVPSHSMRTVVLLRWAAAAILLLVAGACWLYRSADDKQEVVVVAAAKTNTNDVRVQSNTGASIRVIQLADKSVVRLSPGSSLSYYASFDTGSRHISLSGKAIFEVAKDSMRPFTVYTGNITTTALGTTFMVSTLDTNKVQVKLFEGKVAIRSAVKDWAMQEIRLHPGQQFVIDKQSGKFVVTAFKDSAANKRSLFPNTTNVALEFQQEPLVNVLARIGKRYNVQFTFREADNFSDVLVTGKFLSSDSLHRVLSMLGTINKLSFKEYNGKIEVSGRQ